MHRRSVAAATVVLAAATVAAVVFDALATTLARAGTSNLAVKVTPNQGLRPGQTVLVSGRGLPRSTGGTALTWFITECTDTVRGRMNPATDTPHCDITRAEGIRVGRGGTFSAHYRLTTGIIGDGYCGTTGHATCVIGVGTAQGVGTVVRITFRTPPAPPAPTATSTSTTG